MNLDALLRERVVKTGIPALAAGVSQDGTRTVANGGRLPSTAETSYRIASLTKAFTSAATVLALHDRSIPLSTAAIELLPSLASSWQADRRITVEQLLAQVSGLRASVDATAMAALGDSDGALQEAARLVVRAGNDHEPGRRWSYYNGNYFILGAILSGVTGTSYEDALIQNVVLPLNLIRTGFETTAAPMTGWDRQSPVPGGTYPRARRPSGGLWSCVADLLTFAEHLLDMTTILEETRRARTPPDDPIAYGLGWALGPSGQMYLNGRLPGYRTAFLLLPDRRYASVVLANEEHALYEIAQLLSDLQRPLTGDDLTSDINAFAA